jgi:hypothetical protein
VINLHPKNSESLSISLSLYLSLSFEYNCESMQTAAACQVLMVWRVWRSMSLRKRWSVSAKGAKPHPLLVHPSSLGPSASPMWNQTNRVLFTQWAWSFKSLRIWSAAMRVVYLMSSNQFKTQNANSGLYDCINTLRRWWMTAERPATEPQQNLVCLVKCMLHLAACV